MADSTYVLLTVGGWESRCGACGKGALPSDIAHTTPCGYDQHEGCGAVFTHIIGSYAGTEQTVREMRPDLTYGSPVAPDNEQQAVSDDDA